MDLTLGVPELTAVISVRVVFCPKKQLLEIIASANRHRKNSLATPLKGCSSRLWYISANSLVGLSLKMCIIHLPAFGTIAKRWSSHILCRSRRIRIVLSAHLVSRPTSGSSVYININMVLSCHQALCACGMIWADSLGIAEAVMRHVRSRWLMSERLLCWIGAWDVDQLGGREQKRKLLKDGTTGYFSSVYLVSACLNLLIERENAN